MGTKYRAGKKPALKLPEASDEVKTRKFEFPSNVRQIGGINKGIKIYIEDYAYTYIYNLSAKKDGGDTAAFLVGFFVKELGEDILVISGIISPPFTTPSKDGQTFSESDWQYAKNIVMKHFAGLEIVGWTRVQPGYGLYLSAADINSHYLDFTEKHAVLFLSDPEEKLDCFFAWNENQDDLIEASGYFIYYDKNNEMNAYTAEMSKGKTQDTEIEYIHEIEDVETVEVLREEEARGDGEAFTRTVDNAKRIAEIQRQKRIIGMMSSVSMLLFFACVIMGIGLLQSGERISVVESQLRELRTGYNNIVSRLNDSVFPAFAAQQQKSPAIESAEEPDMSPSYAADTADLPDSPEASYTPEENMNLDRELGIVVADEPVATQPPDTSEQLMLYVVQTGDTLSHISSKFYGTTKNVSAIMEANGLTDPDKLTPGDKLIIP